MITDYPSFISQYIRRCLLSVLSVILSFLLSDNIRFLLISMHEFRFAIVSLMVLQPLTLYYLGSWVYRANLDSIHYLFYIRFSCNSCFWTVGILVQPRSNTLVMHWSWICLRLCLIRVLGFRDQCTSMEHNGSSFLLVFHIWTKRLLHRGSFWINMLETTLVSR